MLKTKAVLGFAAFLAAATGVGCSDDDNKGPGGSSDAGGKADAGGNADADAGAGEDSGRPAQYLMAMTVAGDGNNGSLYVMVQDEIDLDVKVADLAAAKAIEFEPYTGIAAIDGHLIVGKSNEPVAQKWSVSESGEFKQVGKDLRFDDYFMSAVDGLNFYFQAIDGTDMFLHYGSDRTFRKHWNIRDWTLGEDFEETSMPTPPAGWALGSTGNRTGMHDWNGAIFQTFNMVETATNKPADKSYIGIYDETSFQESNVLEIACPGLQQQTKHEDGSVFVSTTYTTPTRALYGVAPKSCIVRLKPDGTLDEEWGQKTLDELTGGFDGVNFRYLSNGKALANVLHHDRIQGVDWKGPVDPAVVAKVEGEWVGDTNVPPDATLWDVELLDIEAGTTTTVTGWENGHDVAYYLTHLTVDGRTFITYQIDPYGPKPVDVMYELDVENAKVKKVGDLEGTFAGLFRLH